MDTIHIAVIGLGPAGLIALKTLREEGFQAIGFERREKIGGLWSFTPDTSVTSALPGTVANISKFISGFSDFPIPKEYPTYPTASQVQKYFDSYAKHFGLQDHCRFGIKVTKVVRDKDNRGWNLHIVGPDGADVLYFDKVVFGTGCEGIPKWPAMPGRSKFKGTIVHGQEFRSPEQFAGKRVLVVGIGNTACDISLSLINHASKIYQGYRRGRILVSRYLDSGMPLDSTVAWPILRLKYFLDYWIPWLTTALGDKFMINKMINDAARHEPADTELSKKARLELAEYKIRNVWGLIPCPSMAHEHPAVQETFIPALYKGDILPVRGFQDFVGETQVLLTDGSIIEVDAVILCTGYSLDFNIMPELEMNGACGMPETTFQNLKNQNGERKEDEDPHKAPPDIPRLYQTIFPPRYAKSIAFLSWMAPQENVWSVSELSSMALTQIWAAETAQDLGRKQVIPAGYRTPAILPSLEAMNAEVDSYHQWWRDSWKQDSSVRQGIVRGHTFYRFLHANAGTGMYENLDHIFTTSGWRLWWQDSEVYKWLSGGPANSYAWRLFETNPLGIPGCGRKVWSGARKAVRDAFEIYEQHKRDMENDELREDVFSTL